MTVYVESFHHGAWHLQSETFKTVAEAEAWMAATWQHSKPRCFELTEGNSPAFHILLTDQGAFVHKHVPASWYEAGDGENGPSLEGGPAYDCYQGDVERWIMFEGVLHREVIDWAAEAFFARFVDRESAYD